MNNWYYYLHTNGDLISKNPVVVESDPSYFDSPFVKNVWNINLHNRADAWKLCIESLALGAKVDRVKELTDKWELTKKDLPNYLERNPEPTSLQKKGLELFMTKILVANNE